MVLLYFMRWLRAHTSIEFSVLLHSSGGIEPELRSITTAYLYSDVIHNQQLARDILENVTLIYSNTIGTGHILDALPVGKIPIIIHVHELEFVLNILLGKQLLEKYRISHFIAASYAVKENLVTNHAISANNITVIHEGIPEPDMQAIQANRDTIRQHLGYAADNMVIGGCGSVEWRKGPDLFIQAAQKIHSSHNAHNTRFAWLGAPYDNAYARQIQFDVDAMKLQKYVQFIGPRLNLYDYMGAFDIFMLPSREDPFPLVVLMAASMRLPIICFAEAGGIPEFVEYDAGYIIPYGDTTKLASKVTELINNPSKREKLGAGAQKKFKQSHTIDTIAPQLAHIIGNYSL